MSHESSWRRLALLLAALLVAAVAGLVWLGVERDGQDPDAAGDAQALVTAGQDAEVAARGVIERMTTYDWRTADRDFDWVETAGTERFRSYFTEAGAESRQVITSLKASATGTVVESAPRVEDADHVTVLLFVDQEIRAAGQRGARLDQPRVTMDMVRVDGRWLADSVDINNLTGD